MTYHPGHSERRNLKCRMTSASRRDWMQRRHDRHRYRFAQEGQWHPARRPGGKPGGESMNVDDEDQEEEEEEALEPNPKIRTKKGPQRNPSKAAEQPQKKTRPEKNSDEKRKSGRRKEKGSSDDSCRYCGGRSTRGRRRGGDETLDPGG